MKSSSEFRARVVLAILLSSPSFALSGETARMQISPTAHPLAKSVVRINQAAPGPVGIIGNGFVVGDAGCHVLTNFHVAYGKAKDTNGKIVLVDRLETGHVVDVGFDLNAKGTFDRTIKARVVEFLNYHPTELRRIKNDQAILRLDACVGRAYAARVEIPAEDAHVPMTLLYTLSLSPIDVKTTGLYLESECLAANDTPVAGVFFQSCESRPGMSGSPIFRKDDDGGYTIVGMTTGFLPAREGGDVPFAIFSSAIGPFVQSVVGSGTVRVGLPSNPSAKPTDTKNEQDAPRR